MKIPKITNLPKWIGEIGQFGGLIAILGLIVMEIIFETDIWLVIGTGISFGWAISTKIAHHGR